MIRQDDELWMKKMREVLKDYSEPLAPDGWERLEGELRPVMRRRVRPSIWWAAAAVALLAVSGISLLFIGSPTADDIRHIQPPALAVTPDVVPDTKGPERFITHIHPVPATDTRATKNIEDVQGAIAGEDPDKSSETLQEETPQENAPQGNAQTEQATQTDTERTVVRPSGKDKYYMPVAPKKKRSSGGKWSVGASFSNASGSSSVTQSREYLRMADGFLSGSSDAAMISIGSGEYLDFQEGIPYVREVVTLSKLEHKQPISFGLSVRKQLSNGFSVESGVTYTMLSSEGKSMYDSSKNIEQKLHYIGIPLRGNWNFVDSERFALYLTAGGMIEKCVYGKIDAEKQTVKPLQFSLAGGIGGQLNISNHIGIYVEPGVSYFFDDGSDMETIRKEKPLNINLQGGIRFTY